MENTRRLDIPGAKGRVEVDGVLGLLYKITLDGEPISRRKGAWAIPMRNGTTSKITANGLLPGFQTLRLDGKPILKMGAHVQAPEKIAMFAPVILLAWLFLGAVAGVILFLMNIMVVKNPQFPRPLRVALPLLNTAVVALLFSVLIGTPL